MGSEGSCRGWRHLAVEGNGMNGDGHSQGQWA